MTRKSILIFSVIVIFFVGIFVGLKAYADNISEAYDLPQLTDGVLDMEGKDLSQHSDGTMHCIMKGKWEFFYNKWIITDEYDGESDGMIEVNGSWTGKTYGGEKLPRTGYASYRGYIINAPIGMKLIVTTDLYANSTRIFINGEKVYQNGVVSKEYDEVYTYVRAKDITFYEVVHAEEIEIVIEIAQNRDGGLYFWPTLSDQNLYQRLFEGHNWFGSLIPYIFLGTVILFLFVVGVLNLIKIGEHFDMIIIAYILCLLAHYCFSLDIAEKVQDIIRLDYRYYDIFAYFTGIVLFGAFIITLNHYGIVKAPWRRWISLVAVNFVAMTGYILLVGHAYRYIFSGISLLSILFIIWLIVRAWVADKKYAFAFLSQAIFIFMMFTLEVIDNNGIVLVGAIGVYSVTYMIMVLLILIVYIIRVRNLILSSRNAEILKQEILDIKNKALKAQIKPHFVFNMLTTIQDLYHSNITDGDSALSKFARHLRLNIDAENRDMVSFSEELDNIQNYFDLENFRSGKRLNLLYDIEYTDFYLPILSLQPLIENAVKYAGTHNKPDGYIQIRSYENDGDIVVEVSDNGIGFDKSKVCEKSTGIYNVTERLKYSVAAKIDIQTQLGEGTIVTINIPKGGTYENNNN